MRRFTALAATLILSAGTAAAPAQAAPPLPVVSPTPQQITRIGPDLDLPGNVAVITGPGTDPAAATLLHTVLRQHGIGTEPGAPLTISLGHADGLDHAEGYTLRAENGQVTLAGADPAGQFYAVQTLRQLILPGPRIAGAAVIDHPAMPVRGTIEGFYGSPWTHAERLDQLTFYGRIKNNTYVYAPKDDPYHRDRWREPYPAAKLAELRELAGTAAANHVRFTFALSPGTTICYSSSTDRQALTTKLQAMYDAGVRDFSIPLDDISYTRWNCAADQATYGTPGAGAAARAQVDLLNSVQRGFVAGHPGTRPLQMVPTEYGDLTDTAYKQIIRATLDPAVLVMWTGTDVVPASITVGQATRASELFGRDVLVWDNYPVNDYAQAAGRLLLAPYTAREPGLSAHLAGIVANPMNQAAASKPALFTIADFAWNDHGYDQDRSLRQAALSLTGGDESGVPALLAFFDLNHLAPTFGSTPWQPQAPVLAARLAEPDPRPYVRSIAAAPAVIRATVTDPGFLADAANWLDATALWGQALDEALTVRDAIAAADAPAAAAARQRMTAREQQARQIRSVPGENRVEGPVQIGDGVIDVFLSQVRAEHDRFLGLHPVQNLALGRTATQISDWSAAYPAGAAVNGDLFDFSTTSGAEAQPWWQVDLGATRDVETVAVHNRVDCCAERVAGYHVLVSDRPFPATLADALASPYVTSVHESGQAARPTIVAVPARGRYVRLWLATTSRQELNVAEVQVFGR